LVSPPDTPAAEWLLLDMALRAATGTKWLDGQNNAGPFPTLLVDNGHRAMAFRHLAWAWADSGRANWAKKQQALDLYLSNHYLVWAAEAAEKAIQEETRLVVVTGPWGELEGGSKGADYLRAWSLLAETTGVSVVHQWNTGRDYVPGTIPPVPESCQDKLFLGQLWQYRFICVHSPEPRRPRFAEVTQYQMGSCSMAYLPGVDVRLRMSGLVVTG